MRRIDRIILHCSATPRGRDFGAADITRWHLQRGFNTIGYHYVVRLDGSVERGRPLWQTGAHCKGLNAHSIGICYIGGIEADGTPADTRTPEQNRALERLLHALRAKYPKAVVSGHNQHAAKACPSFSVPQWLRSIRFPESNIQH